MKTIIKEEIEEIIRVLDDYLYKGYLLKTHKVDEWNLRSLDKNNPPNLDAYKKEFHNQINLWLNETANYLTSHLKEKHYFFHLVHPKSDGLVSTHAFGNLITALERHLFALEDIVLHLEERRNLAVRQEIAEKEYQTDILYKITYSEHTREIKLNNIVLARLQSDSKNVNFFEYVYSHPNEQLSVKDIEKSTAYSIAENIHDILRDLGFKGNIRKVFFPIATKVNVMFSNPITKQYAIKNDLPTIKLSRDNETEREATSQNE
jgi:hypothetical protein